MTTQDHTANPRPPAAALLALALCLATLAATPAFASPGATSSAYGESINLTLLPLLGGGLPVASGPLPAIAGSAPAAYNQQGSLASVNVQGPSGLGTLLSTGIMNVEADSAMPATAQAHGHAEVDNPSLAVAGLLGLRASMITADASITGTCGSGLTTTGSSSLAGAQLSGLAAGGLGVAANPAPNTVLLDLLGIRVVLNEQITAGDGFTTSSLTVNAVHVSLSNTLLSLLGALSGDVVISQARATMDCSGSVTQEAALSVGLTANPSPAKVGQALIYTLTVSNTGPSTASSVTAADALPAGLSLSSVTTSQGSCTGAASLSCALGTLAAGSSATVTITTLPSQAGTVIDSSAVNSGTPNPNAANNTASVSTVVDTTGGGGGGSDAAISITATASPSPATVGSPLVYTITVTNGGPAGAAETMVTDIMPGGASLASVTSTQGTCTGTESLSCSLGTIPSGGSVTITMTLVPTEKGTMVDSATVSCTTTNSTPGSDHVTVSTVVNASGTTHCVPGSTVLCIDDQPGDQRFQVTVAYATVQSGGEAGSGRAISLAPMGITHGGIFWFFEEINPEMLIKVINACTLNQKFWVFYSAGTNVSLITTVTDTRTGLSRVYTNPDRTAAPPIQDTAAFACGTATDSAPGGAVTTAGTGIAAGDGGRPIAAPVTSRAAARSTNAASATCTADANSMCIAGRFLVQVAYKTVQAGGKAGFGQPMGLESLGIDQGGIFWFFDQSNPEMLIKVLDACAIEQTFWVFYSATTNVGLTVTVTDTQTGHSVTYTNPDLTAAPPIQDTRALPCS
jgi:uncharacterized repeat protein (TIGR01451 family)